MQKSNFLSLTVSAFNAEIIKKLVLSRPCGADAVKVSGRLCAHRGKKLLALEFSLPSGTVRQENLTADNLEEHLSSLMDNYKQANLITTLGDAEYKVSKKGKSILLGADAIMRKLSGEKPSFEKAIEALDKKKNYILSGNEDFLIALGISDKNGRVHDKRQGKFRQINRFLEHLADVYHLFPEEKKLTVYDLCCGKSYLSFAVYYYLTALKGREAELIGIDLKGDVIEWCERTKALLGFDGMHFFCDDIKNTPENKSPDLVISLHACDVATDIVLDRATALGTPLILSTPCCHRYLSDRINTESLGFVTKYPHLKNKMCDSLTDALRALKLESLGYSVTALELTDPENTPKNTLIRAIKKQVKKEHLDAKKEEYTNVLKFLLGDGYKDYLSEFCK